MADLIIRPSLSRYDHRLVIMDGSKVMCEFPQAIEFAYKRQEAEDQIDFIMKVVAAAGVDIYENDDDEQSYGPEMVRAAVTEYYRSEDDDG